MVSVVDTDDWLRSLHCRNSLDLYLLNLLWCDYCQSSI